MLTCFCFCDHSWGSFWINDMLVNVNLKVAQKQVLTSINNLSRNGKWKRTFPSFPKASMMSGVIYRIVIVIRHWRITCNWSLFNKGFCTIFAFVCFCIPVKFPPLNNTVMSIWLLLYFLLSYSCSVFFISCVHSLGCGDIYWTHPFLLYKSVTVEFFADCLKRILDRGDNES